ncbi:MAG TPA: response regulator transcription factor [Longimicrobiaceae bacterium]|nr:response regulator transcription factor [Longimicrobiaceae bacterium]
MRVLIVEDSPRISNFLRKGLSEEGYAVETAADGNRAFELASEEEYDAAVVDVMLPGRSGTELVRDLRAKGSRLPILLLTARDRTEDKIEGLDAGADDYLTKPFDFAELTARLRALLRRSGGAPTPTLRAGEVELDPATREVRHAGEAVQLTPKEFALLEFLMRNPNRPLSRAMIMEHVWGIRFDPGTNVVDVFINALRNKLDPEHQLIQTVRGVGYMIREPHPASR